MADLEGLETFVAVARLGSLVRAAERLRRTQPTLSARLARLEAAWRTRLFRRQARGMTLTPEGARLLPMAEAVLDATGALDAAAGLPVAPPGEVRVGAGDALGRRLLPRALSRSLAREPGVAIRLVEGPAPRLLELLRAGEIDLALVAARAADEASAGLERSPLLESEILALLPAGRGAPKPLSLADLRDRRLISLQRGSAFRRHIEEAFEGARIPFRPAVEVGNLSLVQRFVAAGLGIGLAPEVAFAGEPPPAGVVRARIRGVSKVGYVSVRREGVPLSREASSLLADLDPQNRHSTLFKSPGSRYKSRRPPR